MSKLSPTKNTGLIVDDFISYANAHLASVVGVVNTVSLYPPLGTPAPGVVNWTGYSVDPAQPTGTAEDQEIEEGDDTPIVEGNAVSEHEKENNVTITADQTLASASEETVTAEFNPYQESPLPQPDPGAFEKPRFKPKPTPVVFGQQSADGTVPQAIAEGPPPKIYGNVGATRVPAPPIFNGKYPNGYIALEAMTAIENGGNYRYNGKYLLHPEAAIQYFKLKKQAKTEGITWTITSAYRSVAHQQSLGTGSTIAKPGSSPHGWGIAIDFSELYRQVGGSGNPAINKAGREKSSLYRWLSNNGPKYGWYNPARLADGGGVDEMWHWEYWGFYVSKV